MATFVAKMKIRIYDFVFLGGECELGWGYFGGRCGWCASRSVVVVSGISDSLIDGSYSVLLTPH